MKVLHVNFQAIKEKAKTERWSGHAIAKATEISPAAVYQILNGQSEPSAINLKKICDVIGLPIETVFTEQMAA